MIRRPAGEEPRRCPSSSAHSHNDQVYQYRNQISPVTVAIKILPVTRSILIVILAALLLLFISGMVSAGDALTSVSPSSWQNAGSVYLTVYGANLGSATEVRLNRCKAKYGTGEAPFYGTITEWKTGYIVARFDLTGKKLGYYDVSVNVPFDDHEDWHVGDGIFMITDRATTTTATTTTTHETTHTSTTTESTGDNTVYFETNPSGATVFVDGDEVGTSTFIYHTSMDGIHDVLVKKLGYEDYSDRVTIIEDSRVRFYAELTPLSSSITVTTSQPAASSGTPVKTATTSRRSTLKIPTPLGEITPFAEESPADPSLALLAAGIAAIVLVFRRR